MTASLLTQRRFLPLFISLFASSLGDTLLRNALAALVLWTVSNGAPWIVAFAAAAFVLPAAFLSGLGGELADRMDKSRLIRILKLIEIPIAFLAAAGLMTENVPLVLGALAAFGVVASLFAPVKYGILPDHIEAERLPVANALVEGAVFAAILIGSVVGTVLTGKIGATEAGVCIVGLACLSWLSARTIPASPAAAPELRVQWNILTSGLTLLRELRADRRSWYAALVAAWFWIMGVTMLSLLSPVTRDVLKLTPTWNAVFLALFAVGIATGSALAAFLCGGRAILLPVSFGASLSGLAMVALGFFLLHPESLPFVIVPVCFFVAALGGGLIAVPTQAAIQTWANPQHRARVVAGMNMLAAIGMTIASLLLSFTQRIDGESAAHGSEIMPFFVIGVITLLLVPVFARTLTRNQVGELLWCLFRVAYRVEVQGEEHYPLSGEKAVITPNHVSWLDAALIVAIAPCKPTFAIDLNISRLWWVRTLLRFVPTVAVESGNPFGIRTMAQVVEDGAALVIFPEGRITVTGSLMGIQSGAASIADRADAPVVAMRIQGAERSSFSRLTRAQTPKALFPKIRVTLFPPRKLAVADDLFGRARRHALTASLRDMMEEAVYLTTPSDGTILQAAGRAARTYGMKRVAIEDPISGAMTWRKLLTASEVLGEALSGRLDPAHPVGLLLPTSNATAVCLFGLWSRGFTPALLNATAGAAGLRAALLSAGITTIVTSRAFVEKARLGAVLEALDPMPDILFLEDVRKSIGLAQKLRGALRARFAPAKAHVRREAHDPAVVLFTSGSSGTPKGVVLTHRNILANIAQVTGRIGFSPADRVLCTLPLFHAFGLTGSFLLPLLSGIPTFLYPSPLHYAVIPKIAYFWNATVLFGTSTFLRGYARKAAPTDFRSVRLVVAGAERVQQSVRELWMEQFGLRIFEGYGVTECSPVVALNTPDSSRSGTVGRLVPGMTAMLETVDGMPDAGRLILSGPNVMAGYLLTSQPGVLQPPANGEYDTGDIVSVGTDGHVTIVGRASRIAKPGGEMVSLAAVEDLAMRAWPEALSVAVSIPDPRKGERIILLTEQSDAGRSAFVNVARESGAADIMIPAEIRIVRKLPLLGSGKPDFVAAQALVTMPEAAILQ
ncbi:MFS transporter [Acetobacter sp.]|jgi:acyl-[acyl-carrier-protein]-phospholipid O-acyltransferase/long-chain-fatty-acid--[acyl-carrier-protein] ligase|uniref:MFS transporter n=1 Tax=Acetobacter sp. TaxID=440 RepID=UPI0025C21459|nr:MFS transporter [Acetobacter sp.]MCH4092323.1 MFS transporter [Acetobacter sp.]MCI1301000.1 MFS transporter [Acetobacter sp.]MCI1317228.1 MFS transporter [Acetobacter sp.]